MVKLVNRLFADYGMPGQLIQNGQARPVPVFFQEKGTGRLQRVWTPLGSIPQGMYLCYFPAGIRPEAGMELRLRGDRYDICRTEPKAGPGGRIYYHWALCARREGI